MKNEITITEVIDKENNRTEDIIVEFPDYCDRKPISFMEVGLVNAKPGLKGYSYPVDTTVIEFCGKLKQKYIKPEE